MHVNPQSHSYHPSREKLIVSYHSNMSFPFNHHPRSVGERGGIALAARPNVASSWHVNNQPRSKTKPRRYLVRILWNTYGNRQRPEFKPGGRKQETGKRDITSLHLFAFNCTCLVILYNIITLFTVMNQVLSVLYWLYSMVSLSRYDSFIYVMPQYTSSYREAPAGIGASIRTGRTGRKERWKDGVEERASY
jgi:hypothetical protein